MDSSKFGGTTFGGSGVGGSNLGTLFALDPEAVLAGRLADGTSGVAEILVLPALEATVAGLRVPCENNAGRMNNDATASEKRLASTSHGSTDDRSRPAASCLGPSISLAVRPSVVIGLVATLEGAGKAGPSIGCTNGSSRSASFSNSSGEATPDSTESHASVGKIRFSAAASSSNSSTEWTPSGNGGRADFVSSGERGGQEPTCSLPSGNRGGADFVSSGAGGEQELTGPYPSGDGGGADFISCGLFNHS